MKLQTLLTLILILWISGCSKFNLTPDVTINFQDPTDITETSFRVDWSINTTEYQSLTFVLAEDPGFEEVVISRTFPNNSTKGTKLESLKGGATYYYRISLLEAPGSIFVSKTKSIEMPFQLDMISFSTPDSALLKGSISYRSALSVRRPAILLMHEYGIFVNGWINSDIQQALVAEGYICMIFWNRGHGKSSPIEDRQILIDNPVYLSNDLKGALNYIRSHPLVMPDSVALMGASMGAIMAIAGNGNEVVRTSVALSPADMIHINYLYPNTPLKSILYVVGKQDIVDTGDEVLDFPAQTADLYERTLDPRKLQVINSSNAHGTELLQFPEVYESILQWIQTEMPVQP